MGYVYVTGFHRAGSHSFAQYKAKVLKLPYIGEQAIKWDSLDKTLELKDIYPKGYVLQCPGLAHKTIDLSKEGKVFWCVRDKIDLITSMRNAGIRNMAWHIMKGFREQFPNDPIWQQITYDGSKDVYMEFVNYYKLLIEVKEYFHSQYFKDIAEIVRLEMQKYYDPKKSLTPKHPLRATQHESLRLYKTQVSPTS